MPWPMAFWWYAVAYGSFDYWCGVAQTVEHPAVNRTVAGSIPASAANFEGED